MRSYHHWPAGIRSHSEYLKLTFLNTFKWAIRPVSQRQSHISFVIGSVDPSVFEPLLSIAVTRKCVYILYVKSLKLVQ